jgi:hypothetical protein
MPKVYSLIGAAAALQMALYPPASHAQYRTAELTRWRARYSANITWNYQNVIAASLDSADRVKAEGVPLDFVLRSGAPFPVSSTRWASRRRALQVSIEAVKVLDDLSVATAWLERNGYDYEMVADYVSLLRQQRDDPRHPAIPGPWRVLGVPVDAFKSADIDDVAQKLLKTAVLFDLAHELGHLLFEDPTTGPTHRNLRTELQADRFAVDLFRRIGVLPIGVGLWVRMNNRWFGGNPSGVSHPVSSERWTALASVLADRPEDFFRFETKPLAYHELREYLLLTIRNEASYAYVCYELQSQLNSSHARVTNEHLARRPIGARAHDSHCH